MFGGTPGAAIPGAGTSPERAAQTTAHRRPARVRFVIKIPKKHHRPRFISPATQSLTLAIAPQAGGPAVVNETVNVTPTSQGCSSTPSATQCVLNAGVPAGSYLVTIATYDQIGAGGNELSHAQSVPFVVTLGQTNALGLTLNGVPHALLVASAARAVHGSQGGGFTVYGSGAQSMVVAATDADGNAIVGAGAPSYVPAVQSGPNWSVTAPAQGTPGTFTVTPPGTNGAGAVLKVTATYSDATCSLAGAICSATFGIKNDMQTLFVGDFIGNAVYAYPPGSATPTKITSNVDEVLALTSDAYSNLFVANPHNNTIYEYTPPYTGAPAAYSNSVNNPLLLAFNASGDLFVGNYATPSVNIYPPPYSGVPGGYNLDNGATGLAIDSQGNAFAAVASDNQIFEYVPPYNIGPPAQTISTGLSAPYQIVTDAAGDLFVVNTGTKTVLEYTPPFSPASAPVATFGPGTNSILNLAIDPAGNVFVATCGAGCLSPGPDKVLVYAPPYTGTPVTITTGVDFPYSLVVDGAGNLFVSNEDGPTVTEYAPPYTGAPIATLTGFAQNTTLAITP